MALSVLQSGAAQYPSASGNPEYQLGSDATAGNIVVAFIVAAAEAANTVTSVTSSIGTFTFLNSEAVNGYDIETWVCTSVTGYGSGITVVTAGSVLWFGALYEIQGSPSGVVSGGTATTSGTSPSLVITPVEAGDLVLAAIRSGTSAEAITAAPSSPWVDLNETAGWIWAQNQGCDAAYQVVSSTSPVTAAWTISSGGTGANVVGVIVKAAAAPNVDQGLMVGMVA